MSSESPTAGTALPLVGGRPNIPLPGHGELAGTAAPAPAPGLIVWITGLSGAGKTTVGEKVVSAMRKRGHAVVWLDGDRLRSVLGADPTKFDTEERLRLAHCYARLCTEIASQGVDVVCTTISMFHRVREWNRKSMARYFEVYLRVPLDELRRRDPKGHYRRDTNLVGAQQAAEEPRAPDLLIDNFGDVDAVAAAAGIIEAIESEEAPCRA